jgi:thiamine biosynthesis lipoprotein
MSNGAFDITVGPLTKLWRRAIRRSTFPEREKLDLAKAKVDYKNIEIDSLQKRIRLLKEGMRLDLGGIAKGYAVDQVMVLLKQHGIKSALVHGGGDIVVSEPPPGLNGWRIEKNKVDTSKLLGTEIILLANKAVATSGDRYKYLEWKGKRYAHIIDPRTGLGVNHRRQVTVIAENCTEADAMASIFSIIDEETMLDLLGKYPMIDIQVLVEKNGKYREALEHLIKRPKN